MFGAYKFSRLVKFSGFNIGFDAPINPQEHAKEVLPVGVSVTTPLFPPPEGSYELPFQVDANGSLWTRLSVSIGAGILPISGQIPADALPAPTAPMDSTSYTMVFNGATWDRWTSMVISPVGFGAFLPATAAPITVSVPYGYNSVGGSYSPFQTIPFNADVIGQLSVTGQVVASSKLLLTGTSFDRERTPKVFKTATATAAGQTAVWTPAAGKRFRLMRVHMSITSNAAAAAAAVLLSRLLDGSGGGAVFFGMSDNNYIPLIGTIQQHQNFIFDLGNGYLSVAANNVLNVDLSFALTAGVLDVTVAGTEE